MKLFLGILVCTFGFFCAGFSVGDGIARHEFSEAQKIIPKQDIIFRELIPSSFLATVDKIHRLYGFEYKLIYRLVDTESRWNPRAVGHNPNGTTDQGLCQLNSSNSWGDISDPNDNLLAGFKYLSIMVLQTGSLEGGLLAYNCGPGRFATGKIPESTIKYAKEILR